MSKALDGSVWPENVHVREFIERQVRAPKYSGRQPQYARNESKYGDSQTILHGNGGRYERNYMRPEQYNPYWGLYDQQYGLRQYDQQHYSQRSQYINRR